MQFLGFEHQKHSKNTAKTDRNYKMQMEHFLQGIMVYNQELP